MKIRVGNTPVRSKSMYQTHTQLLKVEWQAEQKMSVIGVTAASKWDSPWIFFFIFFYQSDA